MMLALLMLSGLVGWYVWERWQRRTGPVQPGLQMHIQLPHQQEWELYHNDFSLCSKKTRVCLAELGIDYRSHHIDLIETGSYENISRRFLGVNPAATVPVLVHNGHPVYESHEQIVYVAAQSAANNTGDNNPSKKDTDKKPATSLTPTDPAKKALTDRWVRMGSLVGDDPMAGMSETAGNAVPGLTLPIFAAMIAHIPGWKIVEGLLFHRIKRRALFFLMLKLRGIEKLPMLKPMCRMVSASRNAMQGHFDELEAVLAVYDGQWIVGDQFTLADIGMMVVFSRLQEGNWLDEFVTAQRPLSQAYWQALQARPSYNTAIVQHSHPLVNRATDKIARLKTASPEFRVALLG